MSYRIADIYHCFVYSDDGQRNCPKHVEFHSKNKFEKLVHVVGFIVRKISRVVMVGLYSTFQNAKVMINKAQYISRLDTPKSVV